MSRLGVVLQRTGITCAFVCWLSSPVSAEPILWFFDTGAFAHGEARIELADGRVSSDRVQAFTDDLGPFNFARTTTVTLGTGVASVSVAQNTTVTPTGWFGSGSAGTLASLGYDTGMSSANAELGMAVGFTLTEPMYYRFVGTLRSGGEGDGFVQVNFEGDADTGWFVIADGPTVSLVTRRGLLSPGSYSFNVYAYQQSFANPNRRARDETSAFSFEFGLADQAPVPEPATLRLFATGAAFLGGRAWRRRKEEQSGAGDSKPN